MRILTAFCLVLCLSATGAYGLTQTEAERFIAALAEDTVDLAELHLPEEFARSTRLGITYEGIRNKFLIGYSLEPEIKGLVQAGSNRLEVKLEPLADNYSLVRLLLPDSNYERTFYFKGLKFISPVYYYTRHFQTRQNEFFSFFIEDPSTFNDYAARCLDSFVRSVAEILGLDKAEIGLLGKEKIIYVLCKDQDSIQELTGFRIRGMGLLSHDCVVTTFSCHYHEVLHLLVNYKLKKLPMLTHPLLREGIAVALGGRGGKEASVILDLGYFLVKSGLVELESLLEEKRFSELDASLAYPVSGLYTLFLLQEIGIERFLELYRQYSRTEQGSGPLKIEPVHLPSSERWESYLDTYKQFNRLSLKKPAHPGKPFFEAKETRIYDTGESYFFQLKRGLAIWEGEKIKGYQSHKFHEILPEAFYRGEKYMILANEEEISVYNLYNNNLVANWVGSFSIPQASIKPIQGRIEFSLDKGLFDKPLEGMKIETR